MIRRTLLLIVSLSYLPLAACALDTDVGFVDHTSELTSGHKGSPLKLKNGDAATTTAAFRPPVEIMVEAKTDSTNIRLSYAADQIIFNWERNRNQLRVRGGPADGLHKAGAGGIPVNKYVTIRWVVTPGQQAIFVDDQLRFEHVGDYSKINKPVSVYCAEGSEVTVKSIKIKKLPPGTE